MPRGVYIRSEQQIQNMCRAQKGRIGPMKGKHHSEETRRRLSEVKKGENTWSKGRKLSLEHRKKVSDAMKRRVAEGKHNFYIDGRYDERKKIRGSLEYKIWRESVFERDNYTCIWCGQVGGKLNADHIKQFALYPELRFDLSNGRTLCVPCHEKTDTYRCRKGIKNYIKNKK